MEPPIHPQKCIGSSCVLVWLSPEDVDTGGNLCPQRERSQTHGVGDRRVNRQGQSNVMSADPIRGVCYLLWELGAGTLNRLSHQERRGHLCQALKGKEEDAKVL